MTTIAYDRPVLDLIGGLDATGHVTHTQHRKDMVTLHHNGGRLSHQGVLSVWQTRPASAHFNVDGPGTVAQYVRVNEYAWATGSTEGNQRSISIEMCNQSLSPDWVVGEATWREAGRLAGWLFLRVIGARPSSRNLVVHKYWFATSCAGPHIDRVYNQILAIAQNYYDTGGEDVITDQDADKIVDRLLNRWLDDPREEKPDGVHNTTVGNALFSSWHTLHYGDAVNGWYPSTKNILDAVEAQGVQMTPEQLDSFTQSVNRTIREVATKAASDALKGLQATTTYMPRPQPL